MNHPRSRYASGAGARLFALILAMWAANACTTFTDLKPQTAAPPPTERPKAVVVSEMKVAHPTWDKYKADFSRGLTDWLRKNGGFESVIAEGGAIPPANSLVLTGTLTEFDRGSRAARIIVGLGAGRGKAKGDFEVRNASGAVLLKFAAQESFIGGGVYEASLNEEDWAARLGETVGKTLVKWLRGEKLD
jgi:uncharacterized protein DUF4410